MTRFLIAAAAITACCMGNQYPAKADNDSYAAGAIYGASCGVLLGHLTEQQSARFLLATLAKRGMDETDINSNVRGIATGWYYRKRCEDFKRHVGERLSTTYAL